MVALMVALTVLGILVAAVQPAVSKVMQREREEELKFRGKQYADALFRFYRRFSRYPNELKEMATSRPRTLRKLFLDPMCSCSDWGLVRLGSPIPGGPPGLPGGGKPSTPTPPGIIPGTYTMPPPSSPKPPGSSAGFSDSKLFKTPGGEPTALPIIGVYSKVHKKAIQPWKGKEYYDEWAFIMGQTGDQPFVPLPPGAPPGILPPGLRPK